MSALEDRLRAGLDADRAVPDLWDAVQRGARRRRARRTAGAAGAASLAVALVATGVMLAAGDADRSAPPAPRPSHTEPPNPGPGAPHFPELVTTAGDELFVTTRTCAGEDCTQGWRYDGAEWSGPFDFPQGAGGVRWAPGGLDGLAFPLPEGGEMLGGTIGSGVTRGWATHDGGRSWEDAPPFPQPCRRDGCQVYFTSGSAFLVHQRDASDPATLYRSDLGLDSWEALAAPDGVQTMTTTNDILVGADRLDEDWGRATTLWVSRDDGATWRRPEGLPCPDPYLFGGGSGGRFVAECYPTDRHEVTWTSPDLRSWTRAGEDRDQTPDHASPIAVSADEVLAWGVLVTPTGNRSVWYRDEGLATGLAVVDATVYAGFSSGPYATRRVRLVHSPDAGRTWLPLTRPVRTP